MFNPDAEMTILDEEKRFPNDPWAKTRAIQKRLLDHKRHMSVPVGDIGTGWFAIGEGRATLRIQIHTTHHCDRCLSTLYALAQYATKNPLWGPLYPSFVQFDPKVAPTRSQLEMDKVAETPAATPPKT